MSEIDWDKAPEWADRVVRIGISKNIAWACDDKYKYLSGDGPFIFNEDPKDGFMLSQTTMIEQRPSPAWSGEGLPPAGCKVEYLTYGNEWKGGTYVGQFNGQMVCGCDDSGVVGLVGSGQLRPIRTPEQIAADEREAAVDQMINDATNPMDDRMIFEKYPGDAFIRQLIGCLYNAGYRKP